jgi:hypothetical protein
MLLGRRLSVHTLQLQCYADEDRLVNIYIPFTQAHFTFITYGLQQVG